MEAMIWMQAVTLGTIVVGGVVVVGKALGKLDRLTTQVNGGFKENKEDHRNIFGRIEKNAERIQQLNGRITAHHGD